MKTPLLLVLLLSCSAVGKAMADNLPAEQRGREIALANCSRCHSVNDTGASTLPTAPPFRFLHERYPVEQLEESLAEGIGTGHPEMPEFRFEPHEIRDFLAYLRSLEKPRPLDARGKRGDACGKV